MKKSRFNPIKLFKNLFTVTCYAFLIVICISYIEIICKNVNPNPQYSSWNIITNFVLASEK